RNTSQCGACWSRIFPVHVEEKDQVVEMLKQPFGYRIEVEPTHQGRTYFDRFISIVKVALMEENAAHEVIFANSADVKNDILKGGARLRKATQMGPDVLAAELKFFTEQLETKTFVPVAWELTPEPVRMGSMPTFEAAQR
ncbi:rab13, partial [Symbiodinium pilosum]